MVKYLKGQHDQMSMGAIKLNTIPKLKEKSLFRAQKIPPNDPLRIHYHFNWIFPSQQTKQHKRQSMIIIIIHLQLQ